MPKVNLKVPKLSGFDKSHQNLLTTKCGTITPILCDELIPNTRVHLQDVISASLPPLASDTFMRVNLKLEAFFVPTRLLYGGYADWLTKDKVYRPNNTTINREDVLIPRLSANSVDMLATYLAPGSLMDYLGARTVFTTQTELTEYFNIFPVLAYHRIYDDWYRNTLIQKPVFTKYTYGTIAATTSKPQYFNPSYLPYVAYSTGMSNTNYVNVSLDETFFDGVHVGDLRQRNFGFDYFTMAQPTPQRGNAQRVTVSSDGTSTGFTIAALRAANSAQQFEERNNLAGPRLQDYVKANYGADLSSGVAQRSIVLGSAEIPVYTKGVYQTTTTDTNISNNPFAYNPGAQFGSANAAGKVTLVKDFVAQEPGYLMVMATMVPVVTYASGVERMMYRYNQQNSQSDMATPILQNVGNQPIYMKELTGDSESSGIFGYTDRYADFKQKFDTLHGLLRDTQLLQSFALQRSFNTSSVQISDDFLKIPTDYMDQVSAVNAQISDYGIWIDCFHDYKVSMPLASYSIPSLQDPAYEHGEDVQIEIGGSRF